MTNSKIICSNQAGIHENLEAVVRRHLAKPFQRPYPGHSLRSFADINRRVQQFGGPLILDSYCGVGESTANLARQHPQALVIGIDKSRHRLDKHDQQYRHSDIDNYILVRADSDDFWRQALAAGWRLSKHYLLYPNPWPKSSHLKRRCHGSPLFPTLLQLGGQLELRSNWALYVEEFCQALAIAGHQAEPVRFEPETAITPFERKYLQSKQQLWHCVCQLD